LNASGPNAVERSPERSRPISGHLRVVPAAPDALERRRLQQRWSKRAPPSPRTRERIHGLVYGNGLLSIPVRDHTNREVHERKDPADDEDDVAGHP
jgi:hypothetical protein